MTVKEIMYQIHESGVENDVFLLLSQWIIADRFKKKEKLEEREATIRAIHKIATQNKNREQAIDGIICLSESEE